MQKMTRCAKTQTLFVQISLSYVDSVCVYLTHVCTENSEHANGSFIPFMLYTTFEYPDFHRSRFFLIIPLSVTPIRILPVNQNDLEILDEFN